MYCIIHIPEQGISGARMMFTKDKRDPSLITQGAGQCFVFELVDRDTSREVEELIRDGRFLTNMGYLWFPVAIREREVPAIPGETLGRPTPYLQLLDEAMRAARIDSKDGFELGGGH